LVDTDLGTAIFGLVFGIIVGWVILHRGRRPFQHDVPAIGWIEKPVVIWKQDWVQFIFVLIHSLSILLIAFLFLLDGKIPAILGSSRVTSTALWMVWVIAGSVFSFPLIFPYAGPMPMFVFSNAFARGQFVGGWDCFSHFRVNPQTRIIYLYAAKCPEIVRVAWQPTTEVLDDVLFVLRSVLPEIPPASTIPTYRRRWALIVAILFLVLPLLGAGVVIFQSSIIWSWIYYTIAVLLIMIFGTTLIRKLEIG